MLLRAIQPRFLLSLEQDGGREGGGGGLGKGGGFVSGTVETHLPKSQELLSPLAWVSYRKALHSRHCFFCWLCLHARHIVAMSSYMPEQHLKRW